MTSSGANTISTQTFRNKWRLANLDVLLRNALVAEKVCMVDRTELKTLQSPYGSQPTTVISALTGTYAVADYTTTDSTLTVADEFKVAEQVYDFEIPLKDIQVKFPEGVNKMIEVNDNVAIRMKYPEAALYNDEEFKKAEGKLMMDLLIKKSIDSVIQDGTTYCFADAPAEEQETFVDELPMKTLEKWTSKIINTFKHICNLSLLTPNSIITSQLGYRLHSLSDRHLLRHMIEFLNRLNSDTVYGLSTRLRL